MKLESKVKQTISKFKLCSKNEKILVALSGGKDSAVTAYLLKKFGHNIEGFYIDLGIRKFSESCLRNVKKLCKNLKIKLHIYDLKKQSGRTMLEIIQKNKKMKIGNCAICGILKKWILNKEARELKADKIATGHNLDDEIQTFLMNIFKGSPELSRNSGAKTKNIPDRKFIPRIKPLFYILEEDIKKYAEQKKLPVVYEKCSCAGDSYRIKVRKFLNTLDKKDKKNIFKNFQEIFSLIKRKKNDKEIFKENKKTKIKYCKICGEPSRNEICKRCELMKK